MTTYEDSGVDIALGDLASVNAYAHAISTFKTRKDLIASPIKDDGGFTGMIDMGDYVLTHNTDGVGTKIDVAIKTKRLETLGYDLLAMVADDALTIGAEVVSVTNTIDVPHMNKEMINQLMSGFAAASITQKIVIAGGEIAEVPDLVKIPVWNATAVGIVEKEKILKPETIVPDDVIISIREHGARSNGFTLIRHILGERITQKPWNDVLLTPSIIYHDAVLHLLGRFKEERKIDIKGIAHITGGGIARNLARVLKKANVGATLTELFDPPSFLRDLIEIGSIPVNDAYETWSMGNGMLIILTKDLAQSAIAALEQSGMEAKIAGKIQREPEIVLNAFDDSRLEYPIYI